eukprot:SAG11_NODE_21347_length_427_cov_0.682927_2_plen_31_part_01
MMSNRASLYTIPEDLDVDKHVCENTQHDPGV